MCNGGGLGLDLIYADSLLMRVALFDCGTAGASFDFDKRVEIIDMINRLEFDSAHENFYSSLEAGLKSEHGAYLAKRKTSGISKTAVKHTSQKVSLLMYLTTTSS